MMEKLLNKRLTNMQNTNSVRLMIYASLFTSLIIIGSYITIPTGIVPIVLANMFIFILALVLPVKWSVTSVTIYLLLGGLGLPVFSGASGGLHHFYGPTGGYLLGYLLASFIISLISSKKPNRIKDMLALLTGFLIIHFLGIAWLIYRFPQGWIKSLPIYWIFLIGDLCKMLIALALAPKIRQRIAEGY